MTVDAHVVTVDEDVVTPFFSWINYHTELPSASPSLACFPITSIPVPLLYFSLPEVRT